MIDNDLKNQQEELAANIAEVRAKIAAAATRSERSPEQITLVAVSKTKPVTLVKLAYECGITDFGENRVQEALGKIAVFRPPGIHWHMIGHLQSNKAGKVVAAFDCVHSVDSLHLAQTLQQHAVQHNKRLPVLLQVNVSGEESKEGVTVAEAPTLMRQIISLPHLRLDGLMTIAPLVQNPEETRPVFRALRVLRDQLHSEFPECVLPHLSMGMTDDYVVAIEEGATIVRIGRAIFGSRS